MAEQAAEKTKRFGTVAIEEGFITQEQLIEAINTQVAENVSGEDHRLIGVILYEKGYIDAPQIKIVLNGVLKASSAAT